MALKQASASHLVSFPQRLDQPLRKESYRPGAEREHRVAGAHDLQNFSNDLVEMLHDMDGTSGSAAHRVRKRFQRHAGNWLLACRVDVGEDDLVRLAERGAERLHQLLCPRESV